MTKWDRLLAALDQVFAFQDRARPTVKKRKQLFDQKTNEHVFIVEYRVVKGEHSDPKKRKEKSIERRVNPGGVPYPGARHQRPSADGVP